MTLKRYLGRLGVKQMALVASALALAACASDERDDTTGSHLYQAPIPQGQKAPPPIEAGDIAIAGQLFSHDIRQLPQVASLTVPQLVQFTGVTSIVRDKNGQLADIDTQPYTALLRDRLLLGDREKLRFVERQLPAFEGGKKHKGESTGAIQVDDGAADFRVLAELRGHADSSALRIQMEFVSTRDGSVLLNGTYRIRRESGGSEQMSDQDVQPLPPPQEDQPATPASSQSASTGVPPVPGIEDDAPTSSLPTHYNPPPPPR